MPTKWTITAAAQQLVLDERRRGEAAFTVTNLDALTVAVKSTYGDMSRVCRFVTVPVPETDEPSLSVTLDGPSQTFTVPPVQSQAPHRTGWYRWRVEPLDDFGTAGPASGPAYFRLVPPRPEGIPIEVEVQ